MRETLGPVAHLAEGIPIGAAILHLALTLTAAEWPQWRGPDRSNVSRETGLLKEWPTNGPPLLWKVVGYEIDLKLVELARENAAKSQVESLVRIEHEDIFTLDLTGADVIAVYLPPSLMERLLPQFEKLKPGTRIVSHQFHIPGVVSEKSVTVLSKEDGDQHRILLWTVPLKRYASP